MNPDRSRTPDDYAADHALFAATEMALSAMQLAGVSYPAQGPTDLKIAAYVAAVVVKTFAENGGSLDAYRGIGAIYPSWKQN